MTKLNYLILYYLLCYFTKLLFFITNACSTQSMCGIYYYFEFSNTNNRSDGFRKRIEVDGRNVLEIVDTAGTV